MSHDATEAHDDGVPPAPSPAARSMIEHARPGLVDWLGAGAAGGAIGGLWLGMLPVLLGGLWVAAVIGLLVGAVIGAAAGGLLGGIARLTGSWSARPPGRWALALLGAGIQTATTMVLFVNMGAALTGDWAMILLYSLPGGALGGLVVAQRLHRLRRPPAVAANG